MSDLKFTFFPSHHLGEQLFPAHVDGSHVFCILKQHQQQCDEGSVGLAYLLVMLGFQKLVCSGPQSVKQSNPGTSAAASSALGGKNGKEKGQANGVPFLSPPHLPLSPAHFILGLEHKRTNFKILPCTTISTFNQMVKVEPLPFPTSGSSEIVFILFVRFNIPAFQRESYPHLHSLLHHSVVHP